MKIIVELDDNLNSDQIVIRCKEKTNLLKNIEQQVKKYESNKVCFYKQNQEYYIDLNDIIFLETDDNSISAHTINDIYYVKSKLYELERTLPSNFIRISKSTIANTDHIYSLNKNLTSSSVIEFNKTYKKVFVSRFYFKNLKMKLKERS